MVVDPDELRALIADAVKDALGNGRGSDWVDASTCGMKRRTFLRLANQGAFPVFRVGNRFVARRADVSAHIESARVRKQPGGSDGTEPVARALAAGRLRIVKKSP